MFEAGLTSYMSILVFRVKRLLTRAEQNEVQDKISMPYKGRDTVSLELNGRLGLTDCPAPNLISADM